MPERLNGTVSKTVWRFMRHEGSNPSLSALARSLSEGGLLFLDYGGRSLLSFRQSHKEDHTCKDDQFTLFNSLIDAIDVLGVSKQRLTYCIWNKTLCNDFK